MVLMMEKGRLYGKRYCMAIGAHGACLPLEAVWERTHWGDGDLPGARKLAHHHVVKCLTEIILPLHAMDTTTAPDHSLGPLTKA